jgi:hypothetical protein
MSEGKILKMYRGTVAADSTTEAQNQSIPDKSGRPRQQVSVEANSNINGSSNARKLLKVLKMGRGIPHGPK